MTDFVQDRLGAMLARLSPPRSMLKNEKAQSDELYALVKLIKSYLPKRGQEEWFDRLEDAVFENLQTRAWPTVFEIKKAIKQITKHSAEKPKDDWEPDAIALTADKIRHGEAVGDGWFYGVLAVELLRHGITEDQLDPYRSALFFKAKDVQGEEIARRSERDWRLRHNEALSRAGMAPRYGGVVHAN